MADTKDLLLRQLDISWALTSYHLQGLGVEECLWRPAAKGLHVHQQDDGVWLADWPESEGYEIGPSSIAWLTWHLGFWLSMVLDHSFGAGTFTRETIPWPGGGPAVCEWVTRLYDQWRAKVESLTHVDLLSSKHTRWPFADRSFGDVVAWANVELMKSAAEIGYVRFAYAARKG